MPPARRSSGVLRGERRYVAVLQQIDEWKAKDAIQNNRENLLEGRKTPTNPSGDHWQQSS
jgi:hypothetical protein